MIKQPLIGGLTDKFVEGLQSAASWVIDIIIDFIAGLLFIEELYLFSISTPAPGMEAINPMYVPESGLWHALFIANNTLTGISIATLFLAVFATYVLNNLGIASGYQKSGVVRAFGVGTGLILMNKAILAVGLNLSSAFTQMIAPSSDKVAEFVVQSGALGALASSSSLVTVGAILVFGGLLLSIVVATLMLVIARYLLIAFFSIMMPLLIAGYYLDIGRISTISDACEGGMKRFVGLLVFPLPFAGVWYVTLIFAEINYFGSFFPDILSKLVGLPVATVALLVGTVVAWKSTAIGKQAINATVKAKDVATQTGAAYATGGASLAAATAMSSGSQGKAEQRLEKAGKVKGTIKRADDEAAQRIDHAKGYASNTASTLQQNIRGGNSEKPQTAYSPSFDTTNVEGQTTFGTFNNPLDESVNYRETEDGQAALEEFSEDSHVEKTTLSVDDDGNIADSPTASTASAGSASSGTSSDSSTNNKTINIPSANALGDKLEDETFDVENATYQHNTRGDPDSKLHQKGELIDDNGNSIPYVSFKDPETGETDAPTLSHGKQYDVKNARGRMYEPDKTNAHQSETEPYIQANGSENTTVTEKDTSGISDFMTDTTETDSIEPHNVDVSPRRNQRLDKFKGDKQVSDLDEDELQAELENDNKNEVPGIDGKIGATIPETTAGSTDRNNEL